jgi:hypothetical protein
MKKIVFTVLACVSFAGIGGAGQANSVGYVKCRTVQGNIIIVQGYTCPAGTVYVGIG